MCCYGDRHWVTHRLPQDSRSCYSSLWKFIQTDVVWSMSSSQTSQQSRKCAANQFQPILRSSWDLFFLNSHAFTAKKKNFWTSFSSFIFYLCMTFREFFTVAQKTKNRAVAINIRRLGCQKALWNSLVLERPIKVHPFKLAGFTDKWLLPL